MPIQIAASLREELARSNLQLIKEITFNSEGNVIGAVNALKVSQRIENPYRYSYVSMFCSLALVIYS